MCPPAVVAQPEVDAVATAVRFGPVLELDVAVTQLEVVHLKLPNTPCHADREMTDFGADRPVLGRSANEEDCPLCMDRLPFASEVVLSEVADMYPAR
jgi:hypothetical protein